MAAAPTGFHPTPRFRISGRYCNRPTTMHKVRQQNRLFGECHHQAVSHNHPSIHSFYCFQAAKSSSCQFLRHCRKNLKCLQNSGYRVLMVSGKTAHSISGSVILVRIFHVLKKLSVKSIYSFKTDRMVISVTVKHDASAQ